ncbi:uncharacterized protein LOC129608609 [Condylostylus longicornis]|uniref:uncharacterized protein LOC129608609 n=1 Tax=Condylostylus longicornis TaxID=2530218 RepID=UPI00244DBE33|nr:uncharacterized protein LOC129608609 [Condylostylus longicornis]
MKSKNLKHELFKNPVASSFLTEILKRRLKMRMKLIKHRRNFVRKQLQQSFQLFQNSVLILFKSLTKEILQIVLQDLKLNNASKISAKIQKNLNNTNFIIENFDETDKEKFLNYYHISPNLFHDICEIWPQKKSHDILKQFIRKIAKNTQDDEFYSKNSLEILKREENICSDIIKKFGYTYSPMTIYECEEAKQKFNSFCGIKISGILVDFKFNSESAKNCRMFAILDHRKRFRSLSAKKLPAFFKDIEISLKKNSSYYFSDVSDSRHKECVIYCENIGKEPCEKLVSFKQNAVNDVFKRWTYLNGGRYSENVLKTCIILHNLCKNKSISMPQME